MTAAGSLDRIPKVLREHGVIAVILLLGFLMRLPYSGGAGLYTADADRNGRPATGPAVARQLMLECRGKV